MEVNGQLHALATLPQQKSPQYLLDRRLSGPQSILDIVVMRKICSLQ